MAGERGRKLVRALAISLVLHAMVLWQTPAIISGSPSLMRAVPRPTIQLALILPGSAALLSAPENPKNIASGEKLRPAVRHLSPPVSSAVQKATAVSLPAVEPAASPIVQDGSTIDANGIRQYRVSLAATARKFKKSSALALASGLSGTAEIRIEIESSGLPLPPQLQHSSGDDQLDDAALQLIGNAVQNTRMPASLRGKSFSMHLPVEFRLDEE